LLFIYYYLYNYIILFSLPEMKHMLESTKEDVLPQFDPHLVVRHSDIEYKTLFVMAQEQYTKYNKQMQNILQQFKVLFFKL
jgi:hypothetical protein